MNTPQVGDVWEPERGKKRRVTKVEDGRVEFLVSRHKYVCPRMSLLIFEFVADAKLIERNGEAVES